ncbi:hypothetical protein DL767_008961 [Monosporascus sp. MG133]|nr:hypothetical protein DL767_008961 [Monosporascus sp. MG133]
MSTAVPVSDKTWHDEHSFSGVESYRIRRALLLFQLYCTLFYQSPNYLDAFFNGRVSEQISFLQLLQTFLVAELDGVYGMTEWIASIDIGVAWILTRKPAPLRPGLGAVPGGAKFEYFMTHDYKYRDFMGRVMPLQNRFFVTALSKYWNFRRTGRINTSVDSVPGVVPDRMEQWDRALRARTASPGRFRRVTATRATSTETEWRFSAPSTSTTGAASCSETATEATAEDIAHWEGYIPPVYEDEQGDDKDEEDEEDEDGDDDDGDDEDEDDEMTV